VLTLRIAQNFLNLILRRAALNDQKHAVIPLTATYFVRQQKQK
jgi:hypothetical protein